MIQKSQLAGARSWNQTARLYSPANQSEYETKEENRIRLLHRIAVAEHELKTENCMIPASLAAALLARANQDRSSLLAAQTEQEQ